MWSRRLEPRRHAVSESLDRLASNGSAAMLAGAGAELAICLLERRSYATA
jgi:hypothetical protein